ncbi:hypothetical protein B0H14DRAFT_3135672 [Mycena olivaceomarginata]|nr:hypothetical protein B0H14DRAFT_3135672 [Mycena olivaceomarginata]
MANPKSKRKATGSYDFEEGHMQLSVPTVKRVNFTSTSDSGSYSSSSVLGTLPTTSAYPTASPIGIPKMQPNSDGPEAAKKRTQNSEMLEDLGEIFDELGQLMLEFEFDARIGTLCDCLKARVNTQCHDCIGYSATCSACFVGKHLQSPFHWAEVWDFEQGFFLKSDISKIHHIIQLGHNGGPCENPSNPLLFTVVHGNGVHATKLAFCGCQEFPINKPRQLMRSRLFPATAKDPKTAFTFSMLKEFSLHNLESKKAAYDYLGAILRLTDNSFTADVPNPYANFRRVVRVWNYLTLKKRAGQMHGIDRLLPHRPAGNLLVWCPACPEPGFNSDPNCPKTPHHLRHCNQSQRTLDGNFQCNQFNKNTDPDDISLCAGKGYFPPDNEYKAYLAKIPVSREKSTCNYLNVVNKRDKKKFKNMAVTGTVNCQCSHVFILSSVDLQLGERFANTDAALAREIRQHKPSKEFEVVLRFEVDDIDKVTTYDIACEYFINLESRFQQHFPDLAEDVKAIRWGVPSLHVQGHQDSCNYLFGTAYMECVGHFHGETAEHYWPEANQLGPHVRQMNNGHRQDTLIIHHGDWNHKKTMKLAVTLANDIALAEARYIEKRDHFVGLTVSFQDRVDGWRALDRTTSKKGKEAISPYKHRTSKGTAHVVNADRINVNLVPSQRAIYQAMLAQDETFQSSFTPKSKVAQFLNDALRIQDDQRKLRAAIEANTEHNLETTQKEVLSRRTKLSNAILAWRQQQKSIAPKLGDKVAIQAATLPAIPVEEEVLFLPSDLTASERLDLDVVALGVEEARWREGEAFDALRAVQNVVKALVALRDRKTKNERQQKGNTRAGNEIADTTKRRDRHMQTYDAARCAMIALGTLTDGVNTSFPPLTVADTFMKSVRQARRVGDSKLTDGLLWRVSGGNVPGPSLAVPVLTTSPGNSAGLSGTQMHTRKSTPGMKALAPGTVSRLEEKREERPEGWLWQLGKMGKLSQNEMDEWSGEGDRVQWFRAEAEMQRWQEQKEQKLVELLRTIRSFLKMQQVWTQLADAHSSSQPGHTAYARQKAAMYHVRAEEAKKLLRVGGYGFLLEPAANVIEYIEKERAKESEYLLYRLSETV